MSIKKRLHQLFGNKKQEKHGKTSWNDGWWNHRCWWLTEMAPQKENFHGKKQWSCSGVKVRCGVKVPWDCLIIALADSANSGSARHPSDFAVNGFSSYAQSYLPQCLQKSVSFWRCSKLSRSWNSATSLKFAPDIMACLPGCSHFLRYTLVTAAYMIKSQHQTSTHLQVPFSRKVRWAKSTMWTLSISQNQLLYHLCEIFWCRQYCKKTHITYPQSIDQSLCLHMCVFFIIVSCFCSFLILLYISELLLLPSYLSICTSIYLSSYIAICLSIWLSIYISIYLI